MNQHPNHREAFGYWLNEAGLLGEGAEIGCAFGGFSRTVLSQWKGKTYYMIDPWIKQSSEVYREKTDGVDYDRWYEDCCGVAKDDPRAKLIRALSVDGAKQFDDGQLDFAYIDGNHSYRNAMEDMDAWWPKVKIGGMMAGHDFLNKTDEGWFCEVERAVIRWSSEHNAPFMFTGGCSSWWIRKEHA